MKSKERIDSWHLELENCFFCDKMVMITDVACSRKDYENLHKLIDTIPDRLGGKIGNKIVCKSCRADIWTMAQDDYIKYL